MDAWTGLRTGRPVGESDRGSNRCRAVTFGQGFRALAAAGMSGRVRSVESMDSSSTSRALAAIAAALDGIDHDRGGLDHRQRLTLVEDGRRVLARTEALVGVLVAEADKARSSVIVTGTPTTSWLQSKGDVSKGEAVGWVFAGRDLTERPLVRRAALDGDISVRQARAIAKVVGNLPVGLTGEQRTAAEDLLVVAARNTDAERLATFGARILEQVAPEAVAGPEAEQRRLEAQRARAHSARALSFTDDGDGSWRVAGSLPYLQASPLLKLIDARVESTRRAQRENRDPGEAELTPAMRRADALCELGTEILARVAHAPTPHPPDCLPTDADLPARRPEDTDANAAGTRTSGGSRGPSADLPTQLPGHTGANAAGTRTSGGSRGPSADQDDAARTRTPSSPLGSTQSTHLDAARTRTPSRPLGSAVDGTHARHCEPATTPGLPPGTENQRGDIGARTPPAHPDFAAMGTEPPADLDAAPGSSGEAPLPAGTRDTHLRQTAHDVASSTTRVSGDPAGTGCTSGEEPPTDSPGTEPGLADSVFAPLRGHRVAGDRPRVVVTISYDALVSRCEQAGVLDTGQSITAGDLRRLACDAELIPVILGTAGEILDYGRSARLVPPALRRALAIRDRRCTFPGCDAPDARCEAHHLVPWWAGGTTCLENLILMCPHHHALVEPPRFWSGPPPDRWQARLDPAGLPEFLPPRGLDPSRTPRTNRPPR